MPPPPKPPPRLGSCGSVGLSFTPDRPPPTASGATVAAGSVPPPQALLMPLVYRELVPVRALYTELARGSLCGTEKEEEEDDDDSMRVSSSRSNGSERNLVRRSSKGSLVREDVRREARMRCEARCWPLAEWARERRAAAAATMEDASEGWLLCRLGAGCLRMPRRRCCCCCCCRGVMAVVAAAATFRASEPWASEKGSCSALCSRLARRARAGTGCTTAGCFSPYSGVMSGAPWPTP